MICKKSQVGEVGYNPVRGILHWVGGEYFWSLLFSWNQAARIGQKIKMMQQVKKAHKAKIKTEKWKTKNLRSSETGSRMMQERLFHWLESIDDVSRCESLLMFFLRLRWEWEGEKEKQPENGGEHFWQQQKPSSSAISNLRHALW